MISAPLRLRDGFLQRTTEEEAIVSLLRIMASTPRGSWSGFERFGIRDFFEDARMRPDLPQRALEEINTCLTELGLSAYTVESITREEARDRNVDTFVVSLAPSGGGPPRRVNL